MYPQSLRGALNAHVRTNNYGIENISAAWNVLSLNQHSIPGRRGGALFIAPALKKGLIVFVCDPAYNNWAEESGLVIIGEWINPAFIPYKELTLAESILVHSPNAHVRLPRTKPNNKITYEEAYDDLRELVESECTLHHMAGELNLSVTKVRMFKIRFLEEQYLVDS